MTDRTAADGLLHVHLANGLEVLVRPMPGAPLAAVYLWVDVGAAHDPPAHAGMAHLLEHLLFKGTPTRGVGELAAAIEDLGGDLNAYTTWDHTCVHATVPADGLDTALDVIADMAQRSTFDPDEFNREKPVVLEEIRGYDDDPSSIVSDTINAAIYPQHPYGRPVLGTVESVSRIDRDALVTAWRTGWRPERALVVVAGAVNAEQTVDRIAHWFGGWVPGGEVPEVGPAALGPARVIAPSRSFTQPSVEIAWPIPGLNHPDLAALDVLVAALGDGRAALLGARLQTDEHLATDVWASLAPNRHGGSLTVSCAPRQGETLNCVDAMLETIDEVRRAGLSSRMLARARTSILSSLLFTGETVDGVAHELAWYARRAGDPRALQDWQRAVSAVDADAIVRVARRWLNDAQRVIVVLDRAVKQPAARARATKFDRASSQRAPRTTRDGVVRHTFDNGVRLLIQRDDAPVCAVHVGSLGGRLLETAPVAGIGNAWSTMLGCGAGRWGAESFSEALDDIGATLNGASSGSLCAISSSFPMAALGDGLEIISAVIVEPGLTAEDWDRERDDLLDEIATLDDRPDDIAYLAISQALYPDHPLGLPWNGTRATLRRISSKRLVAFHDQAMRPAGLVVAVTGNADPELVIHQLEPWLGALEAPVDAPAFTTPALPVPRAISLQAGADQALVAIACRGVPRSAPERYALRAAATILGAQSGRLFMALRERRSLAYSVWCDAQEGLVAGSFTAGLAADPARVAEASDALHLELERFATDGPTPSELERARRMLLNDAALALQRASGRAAQLVNAELFGLSGSLAARRAALDALTPDAVQVATRAALDRGLVAVTVTPRAPR